MMTRRGVSNKQGQRERVLDALMMMNNTTRGAKCKMIKR